jgi:hypothetical protein
MVPVEALPPGTLFTSQVTPVLLDPVTVAVNCCVPFAFTVALVGAMVIATVVAPPPLPLLPLFPLLPLPLFPVLPLLLVPPPQAVKTINKPKTISQQAHNERRNNIDTPKAAVTFAGVDEQQLGRVAPVWFIAWELRLFCSIRGRPAKAMLKRRRDQAVPENKLLNAGHCDRGKQTCRSSASSEQAKVVADSRQTRPTAPAQPLFQPTGVCCETQ